MCFPYCCFLDSIKTWTFNSIILQLRPSTALVPQLFTSKAHVKTQEH